MVKFAMNNDQQSVNNILQQLDGRFVRLSKRQRYVAKPWSILDNTTISITPSDSIVEQDTVIIELPITSVRCLSLYLDAKTFATDRSYQ